MKVITRNSDDGVVNVIQWPAPPTLADGVTLEGGVEGDFTLRDVPAEEEADAKECDPALSSWNGSSFDWVARGVITYVPSWFESDGTTPLGDTQTPFNGVPDLEANGTSTAKLKIQKKKDDVDQTAAGDDDTLIITPDKLCKLDIFGGDMVNGLLEITFSSSLDQKGIVNFGIEGPLAFSNTSLQLY